MYILGTFFHIPNNFFVIWFLYIIYSIYSLCIDIEFLDYYIYHIVVILYISYYLFLSPYKGHSDDLSQIVYKWLRSDS